MGRDDIVAVLEENIAKAEKYLEKAEHARERGWLTAYDVCINAVPAILKCTKFCIECAKAKKAKLDSGKDLECMGGCVKGRSFDDFNRSNKDIWYVRFWTRRNDTRYR